MIDFPFWMKYRLRLTKGCFCLVEFYHPDKFSSPFGRGQGAALTVRLSLTVSKR